MLAIGKKVYYISQCYTDTVPCTQCNGRGHISWEDDWGGYRGGVCSKCSCLGYQKIKISTPKCSIVGPVAIDGIDIRRKGITYLLNGVSISSKYVYTTKKEVTKVYKNMMKELEVK